MSREVRAKKPSLTLNLGINGLKVTSTNDRAGWLLARTGSLTDHPSKQQPRSTITAVPATLRHWLIFDH
ncbi:hypothetical protein J6590_054222 [Homalodisca vitripennis]|nr:hypothetical protein J6590_054222 [Homalodisca vitripennis]